MKTLRRRGTWALALVWIAGCAPGTDSARDVDTARITAADDEPQNWLTHGRTYGEQRFSPLAAIGRSNVEDLGLACVPPERGQFELPQFERTGSRRWSARGG